MHGTRSARIGGLDVNRRRAASRVVPVCIELKIRVLLGTSQNSYVEEGVQRRGTPIGLFCDEPIGISLHLLRNCGYDIKNKRLL